MDAIQTLIKTSSRPFSEPPCSHPHPHQLLETSRHMKEQPNCLSLAPHTQVSFARSKTNAHIDPLIKANEGTFQISLKTCQER